MPELTHENVAPFACRLALELGQVPTVSVRDGHAISHYFEWSLYKVRIFLSKNAAEAVVWLKATDGEVTRMIYKIDAHTSGDDFTDLDAAARRCSDFVKHYTDEELF